MRGAVTDAGVIDRLKSPTLNGIETCCVTVPSEKIAVGEYVPSDVLAPAVMVMVAVSTWPAGKSMSGPPNWQVAPLGRPWHEG